MITVSNAKKHYPGFDLDCSLDVKAGMITGLIGRNGAGKTTLFKCILGLAYPDSGTIKICGKDIKNISDEDREKIGTVLSDSMLSGYITIGDAKKILKSFYPAFNEEWFNTKCRENKLDYNKKIKELSTGMKAKLNIISALSHDAEILSAAGIIFAFDMLLLAIEIPLRLKYGIEKGRIVLYVILGFLAIAAVVLHRFYIEGKLLNIGLFLRVKSFAIVGVVIIASVIILYFSSIWSTRILTEKEF